MDNTLRHGYMVGGMLLFSITSVFAMTPNTDTTLKSVAKGSDSRAQFHEANVSSDAGSLREGKVESIDLKEGTIKIRDQLFRIDKKKLRVFSKGRLVPYSLIINGETIHFLLDPLSNKNNKLISVVYLSD